MTKNCICLGGNIDRPGTDRSCASKTATTLKRNLFFSLFFYRFWHKEISTTLNQNCYFNNIWSSCSPTFSHHVDWYSLQNSIKNHTINVLLNVFSSDFLFPRILLILPDHPVAPLHHNLIPFTHLTDPPKIIEKRGLIQKSFKWAQNHERTMSGSIEKASRHFLKSVCQIPSRRYEYLHNLINAATYLFNSARRKTPLNENMFSILVLSAFEHSDPLTTTQKKRLSTKMFFP